MANDFMAGNQWTGLTTKISSAFDIGASGPAKWTNSHSYTILKVATNKGWDLQSTSHDVILCEHVRETHATGFNLDQNLSLIGRGQLGVLDYQRTARLLEHCLLESLG